MMNDDDDDDDDSRSYIEWRSYNTNFNATHCERFRQIELYPYSYHYHD